MHYISISTSIPYGYLWKKMHFLPYNPSKTLTTLICILYFSLSKLVHKHVWCKVWNLWAVNAAHLMCKCISNRRSREGVVFSGTCCFGSRVSDSNWGFCRCRCRTTTFLRSAIMSGVYLSTRWKFNNTSYCRINRLYVRKWYVNSSISFTMAWQSSLKRIYGKTASGTFL